MEDLSAEERAILVQHAIKKYGHEEGVLAGLDGVIPARDILSTMDMLVATQRVRRIGPDVLENNESHTELPDVPARLAPVIDGLPDAA